MNLYQPRQFDELAPCPYLPDRQRQWEFFLAGQVSAAEIDLLLAAGWRKFSYYFFRPVCPDCRSCTPLRVPVADFRPSRSQRRLLRSGSALRMTFGPLCPSERSYAIYRDHSLVRFGQQSSPEDFIATFYRPSCPAMQSELYLGEEQIGLGFLDRGTDSLSSVYFCFDPHYAHLQPGTFSILGEIAHAAQLGLRYYYLGYYVPGCPSMIYKDHFRPRQHFRWQEQIWLQVATPPGR
jgi:leucyl-tRNA---protein transferase